MKDRTALIIIDVLEGIVKLPVSIYKDKLFFENLQTNIEKARENESPVIYTQHFTPQGSFLRRDQNIKKNT
ncbi:MAG: isochorismatase family protein [Pseudomonadota bacterium]